MSEYSEESGEFSSEGEDEEAFDLEDSGSESDGEKQNNDVGQYEISEVDSVEADNNSIVNHEESKLTDIIKTQQMIIENLRKELALASLKLQNSGSGQQIQIQHGQHRKCMSKSEESTSAVVSSFEDDDDELDSLSSEDSDLCHPFATKGALVTNPLFIDVVIQKVMDHLPLKSLLVARLVCRKWNAMATSQISAKCGLLHLEVHQPWKPSKGVKVSTFIDVMRNSLNCPISKFSISSFTALEELDRFFFHFGRFVKHLDLNFSEEFDDSQEFALLLIRKIRQVESLRVGCCQMFKKSAFVVRPTDPAEIWPSTNAKLWNLKTFCIGNIINIIPSRAWLEEFFRMTPNLEKLVLHVNFKENGNTFIRIVLEALMNLEVLKNIKTLMISCLTESHLRTLLKLAENGLRLKQFRFQDLCLHLTEINGTSLETFLSTQADDLESLEIEQSSNFPRIRHFQIPVMKNLKVLSITSSQRISFGSVNYSQLLPKLEKLVLRGFDVFNSSSIFPQTENGHKRILNGHCLRVLSLPSKLNIPHYPKVLSKFFPNVVDLEVRGVCNQTLREIWGSWPGLERLKLVVSHFDDNIDSGMTGIPEEVCRELRREGQLENHDVEDLKTATGIIDLNIVLFWSCVFNAELTSLEIECRAMWIPCQLITDVTGYFALANLTKLRRLTVTEIGVPEKFDLSNECITVIINTLKDVEATFKIMDDHGRWQLELGRIDLLRNTYESEPQLEDHNKDKEYIMD